MYLRPHVVFQVKSLEDTVSIITSFFEHDYNLDDRFAMSIAEYFGFDITKLKGKTWEQRLEIMTEILTPIYEANLDKMAEQVKEFQAYWNDNAGLVCSELERVFRISFKGIQQYIAEINVNPVCPRFLENKSFDVGTNSTKQQALQTCIHELIHFCWFELWQELFPDANPKHFETPHTEWLFSEIAIDPIIYFGAFKDMFNEKPAYDYFYDAKIWGENLIDVFRKLYKANNIDNFMERGLKILENNPEVVKDLVK